MSDSKKEGVQSKKWAIITQHPWLPSRSEQIARARAWGVAESWLGKTDISALIEDDVRKVGRTTNWMGKLEARANFIQRMRAFQPVGDLVFFANPLCVGFSAKVAEQTVQGLWAAKMGVYVHSVKDNGPAIYLPDDDLTEFLDGVTLAANAAHQRRFRAQSK